MDYTVQSISRDNAKVFLLNVHYAKRMPNTKKIFGLYEENRLIGVCVFGTAPSSFWNNGGSLFNNKHNIVVYELSRLCIVDGVKNAASYFISRCIKLLDKECVIVSYADIDMNHTGFIYQACNFGYYGISKPMCKSKNYIYQGKSYHGRTMNKTKIKKLLGNQYDDSIDAEKNFLKIGTIQKHIGKHRYIYIKSKYKKQLLQAITLDEIPYPKTKNTRYYTNTEISTQAKLL